MRRTRGYGPKGEKLIVRGETKRTDRISMLCYIGISGLHEATMTKGTFTRHKFFDACRKFAFSGKVGIYPGSRSVWVMDGARIHCDKHIVTYLRMLGIQVVFLPAYCPFFNPIELFFGLLKGRMQRRYQEGTIPPRELPLFVGGVLNSFENFNFRNMFDAAGYGVAGQFDPGRAFRPVVDVTSRGVETFDEDPAAQVDIDDEQEEAFASNDV
jgi:hypothetical protein